MLLPRHGASGFVVLALTGQVMASMVLDHFGLFGLVERQLTLPRVFGALLVVAGVVLIQFSSSSGKALIATS